MRETFVIQSDSSVLPRVEEQLFHFCHACNVGDYYSVVSVATMEAVENAIVHGNRSDASKEVTVTVGTCRGGVFAEVTDQGEGFAHERFGDLPAEGDGSGSGIFTMRQLSDRMSFRDGGRTVRMEFDVAGIDPGVALRRASVLMAFRHEVQHA